MATVKHYLRWLLVYLAIGAILGLAFASKDKRFTDANGNLLMTGFRQPPNTYVGTNPLHKHPVIASEYGRKATY